MKHQCVTLIFNKLDYCMCILCLWFRASLIYINNCPTRCNTKDSIYYSASSLYMFRVSTTPIMSTQNCNYSLRCWSYFLCSYLPSTWPIWREVAAQERPYVYLFFPLNLPSKVHSVSWAGQKKKLLGPRRIWGKAKAVCTFIMHSLMPPCNNSRSPPEYLLVKSTTWICAFFPYFPTIWGREIRNVNQVRARTHVSYVHVHINVNVHT